MYRTVIKLKKNISEEQLSILTERIIDNFNNRVGKLDNHSTDPFEFVFEGEGEDAFECIDFGIAILADSDFIYYVEEWVYIDEDYPSENTNVLNLYLYGKE